MTGITAGALPRWARRVVIVVLKAGQRKDVFR
mgnify:CR=1 FL=1